MSLWVFERDLAADETSQQWTTPSESKPGTTVKRLLATALKKSYKFTTKSLKEHKSAESDVSLSDDDTQMKTHEPQADLSESECWKRKNPKKAESPRLSSKRHKINGSTAAGQQTKNPEITNFDSVPESTNSVIKPPSKFSSTDREMKSVSISAAVKKPVEKFQFPSKPKSPSFVRVKLADHKMGVVIFAIRQRSHCNYGTVSWGSIFVDGKPLLEKGNLLPSREILEMSKLVKSNRKPVWALITKDLQSRLFTKAADGTLYKIECHAECIWVGYNPHQIVTNVKDERLDIIEKEKKGQSSVEAVAELSTETLCRLRILPPHPLNGKKVLLQRKNFFIKGLPFRFSASPLSRVLPENIKVNCYIAPKTESIVLPSDCSQCAMMTDCSFVATLAWRGNVPEPSQWKKQEDMFSPKLDLATGFLSNDLNCKNVQNENANEKINKVTLKVFMSLEDQNFILADNGKTQSRIASQLKSHVKFLSCDKVPQNFVEIEGDIYQVEKARELLREMSPIKLEFEVPRSTFDAFPLIELSFPALEKDYNVKIVFRYKERGIYHTAVIRIVSDQSNLEKAKKVSNLIMSRYFGPGVVLPVTMQIDLSFENFGITERESFYRIFDKLQLISSQTGTIVNLKSPQRKKFHGRGPLLISGTFDNTLNTLKLFQGRQLITLVVNLPKRSLTNNAMCEIDRFKSEGKFVVSFGMTKHKGSPTESIRIQVEEGDTEKLYKCYKKIGHILWNPNDDGNGWDLYKTQGQTSQSLPDAEIIKALTKRLLKPVQTASDSEIKDVKSVLKIRSCKELELAMVVSQKLFAAIQHATNIAKSEENSALIEIQRGDLDLSKLISSGNPADNLLSKSEHQPPKNHQDYTTMPDERNFPKSSKFKYGKEDTDFRTSNARTPDRLSDPFRTSARAENRERHVPDFIKSGNIFNPFYSELLNDRDLPILPDDSGRNSPSIPLNIRLQRRNSTPEREHLPLNLFVNETLSQDRRELPDGREQLSPELVLRDRNNSRHLYPSTNLESPFRNKRENSPKDFPEFGIPLNIKRNRSDCQNLEIVVNSPRFPNIDEHATMQQKRQPDYFGRNSPGSPVSQTNLPMKIRELPDSHDKNLTRFPDEDYQSTNKGRELPEDINIILPRNSRNEGHFPLEITGLPDSYQRNLPIIQEPDQNPPRNKEHLSDSLEQSHFPSNHSSECGSKTLAGLISPQTNSASDSKRNFQDEFFNLPQHSPESTRLFIEKFSFFPTSENKPSIQKNSERQREEGIPILFNSQVADTSEQISPGFSSSVESGKPAINDLLAKAKSKLMAKRLKNMNSSQIPRSAERFRAEAPSQALPQSQQSSNLMEYQSNTLENDLVRQNYESRYNSVSQRPDFEDQLKSQQSYSLPSEGSTQKFSTQAQSSYPDFTIRSSKSHSTYEVTAQRTNPDATSQPNNNFDNNPAEEITAQRFQPVNNPGRYQHDYPRERFEPQNANNYYNSGGYQNDFASESRTQTGSRDNRYGAQLRQEFQDPARRIVKHEPGLDANPNDQPRTSGLDMSESSIIAMKTEQIFEQDTELDWNMLSRTLQNNYE